MSTSPFGLAPSDYWDDPKRTESEVARMLSKEKFEGVRIDAPAFVPVEVRGTLPVLTMRTGSYRDMWAVGAESHALLTVFDPDLNRLYVDFALSQEFVRSTEPVDLDQAPKGRMSTMYLLDARKRLGLPWHPSRYWVTVILRERVSNRVLVELGKSTGSFQDPAVEKYIADERAKTAPRAIRPTPAHPYPRYKAVEGCPPIPVDPGLAFVLPRVLPQGSPWLLQGSFRFQVSPEEVVKAWPAEDPNPPSAIFRIHFLITGGDKASPLRLEVLVPSYDRFDPTAAVPIATGCFSIDLSTEPGVPKKAQTYFVYAFRGALLEGPVPSALIEPARLPGR